MAGAADRGLTVRVCVALSLALPGTIAVTNLTNTQQFFLSFSPPSLPSTSHSSSEQHSVGQPVVVGLWVGVVVGSLVVVGCAVVEVTGLVVVVGPVVCVVSVDRVVVIVVGLVPGVPGLVRTQDPSMQTPPFIKGPSDVG